MKWQSLVQLFVFVIFALQHARESESATTFVGLYATKSTYTATSGSSLTMTFYADYLLPTSNVEIFFSNDNSQGSNSVVYSSGTTQNSRFSVTTSTVNSTTTLYSVTISSITSSDASYTVYIRCAMAGTYSTGAVCSSSSSAYIASSSISSVSAATTTASSGSSNNNGRPTKNTVCIESGYLPAEYCLLLLTFLVLLIAAGLYYFPFYDEPGCHVKINESNSFLRRFNLVEFLIFITATILAIVLVVIGLIFWINGDLVYDPNYVSTVIIILDLLACLILWILIIQYCIRLLIKKRIKFYILIFVGVDAFFELFFALLLFCANIYCTGYSVLPALTNSNYSYVEVIAAVFFFIFALLLLLIFGFVYYFLQKTKSLKESESDFHDIKPSSSGSNSSKVKDATTSSKIAPSEDLDKKKKELEEKKKLEKENEERKKKEEKNKKKDQTNSNKPDSKGDAEIKKDDNTTKANTRPMTNNKDPFSSIWNIDDPFAPNSFSGNRDNRAKDLTGARKVKSQEEKNLFTTNTSSDAYLDLFNNSFNNFASQQNKPSSEKPGKTEKKKEKKKSDKPPKAEEQKSLVNEYKRDNPSASSSGSSRGKL